MGECPRTYCILCLLFIEMHMKFDRYTSSNHLNCAVPTLCLMALEVLATDTSDKKVAVATFFINVKLKCMP